MSKLKRHLNHIQDNQACLVDNNEFQFAKKHALCLYKNKSIFTFIPKNACTTLRASIAIANGALNSNTLDKNMINWVHSNSYTFGASLSDIITAQYTFIILRCPYDRMVSLFLDKFVDNTRVALDFYKKSNKIHKPDTLSFNKFLSFLQNNPAIIDSNIHWRKQSDFLVYQHYDDYFDFSNFPHIIKTLKEKIDLELFDTRPLTQHSRKNFLPIEGDHIDHSDTPVKLLKNFKTNYYLPTNRQMLNKNNKAIIDKIYKSDLLLYKKHK